MQLEWQDIWCGDANDCIIMGERERENKVILTGTGTHNSHSRVREHGTEGARTIGNEFSACWTQMTRVEEKNKLSLATCVIVSLTSCRRNTINYVVFYNHSLFSHPVTFFSILHCAVKNWQKDHIRNEKATMDNGTFGKSWMNCEGIYSLAKGA